MSTARRLGSMLLCALLTGCGPRVGCEPQPVTATYPASPSQAALVDSVLIGETDPLVVRRVVLRSGMQADTLPDVLASSLPVVTETGEAIGLGYTAEGSGYAYGYSPNTRVVRQVSLPGDFDGQLSEGSFSADGRYLAYVAFPREGQGEPVVRSWPDGRLVCRGPRVELPATNYLLNGTEWTRGGLPHLRRSWICSVRRGERREAPAPGLGSGARLALGGEAPGRHGD